LICEGFLSLSALSNAEVEVEEEEKFVQFERYNREQRKNKEGK